MKKLAVAVCAAVAAASGAFAGKIYYFDPVNGKDTNDGLTEETAFVLIDRMRENCTIPRI